MPKYACKYQKNLLTDCPYDKDTYELCKEFCKELFLGDPERCEKCMKLVKSIQNTVYTCVKYGYPELSTQDHSLLVKKMVLLQLAKENLVKMSLKEKLSYNLI